MSDLCWARDDLQYWAQYSLKASIGKKFDLVLYSDSRLYDDAGKLGLYFIAPKVIYHYSKSLDLGLNYTYLQSRKVAPDAADVSYNLQQRVELEVNPKWGIADWGTLKMRNRMELRAIEGKGFDNTRYRQRVTFEHPLNKDWMLKSFYLSSEFFYDLSDGFYSENRSVPCGVNFQFNDKTSLSLYYMVQSQKVNKDWVSNEIVGSLLSVVF